MGIGKEWFNRGGGIMKHIDSLCVQKNSYPGNTTITIGVPRYLLKVADEMAWREGTSRSELFRRAFRKLVENSQEFYDFCDEMVKDYDKRKKKEKIDAVQVYMKDNGYSHIRRLEL